MKSFFRKNIFKKIFIGGGVIGISASLYLKSKEFGQSQQHDFSTDLKTKIPSRSEMIKSLQSGRQFDILVIGGGATGTGISLVKY